MKTGKFYRGARPGNYAILSYFSFTNKWQTKLRLKTGQGLQMNTASELLLICAQSELDCNCCKFFSQLSRTEHIEQARKRDAKIKSSAVPQTNEVAELLKIPGITYHEINFNGSAFSRMLISKLSWTEFGKLVGLMVLGYRLEAIKVLSPLMREKGLVGLAIDSLDVCGYEVCQVFTIFAEPSNWPIMIHCTQGKDRTGLTVMLVLFLLGASIKAVEKDYLLSELELLPEKEERLKEIQSIGLTEHFAGCPTDLVPRVHQHIIEKYGSIDEYLVGVGVTVEMQGRIKCVLSANNRE